MLLMADPIETNGKQQFKVRLDRAFLNTFDASLSDYGVSNVEVCERMFGLFVASGDALRRFMLQMPSESDDVMRDVLAYLKNIKLKQLHQARVDVSNRVDLSDVPALPVIGEAKKRRRRRGT